MILAGNTFMNEKVINILLSAVDIKDHYTVGHQQRVATLSCAIAEEMELPEENISAIYMAAMLHDIGKMGIPSHILNKTTKLTSIEISIIKTHPGLGYIMLENIDFGYPVAQIVSQHHERIDGSGYPRGLRHTETFLEAKILSVADVVDAMTSDRPYRRAPGLDKALDEISQNSGILYDAQVADTCLQLLSQPFSLLPIIKDRERGSITPTMIKEP